MSNGRLLWADDEIELLKGHILFLKMKGYEVMTVSNGVDAIEACRQHAFDLVLLDENMPGLSGLEALKEIKAIQPATPIVMVTKSEEENIMDQAIGSQIADYLIKPVHPKQILLSLKKCIHKKEIVTSVTQSGYQQSFTDIAMQIDSCRSVDDWIETYKRLTRWELELSGSDSNMSDMLTTQKNEANNGFGKFVKNHYMDWMDAIRSGSKADRPLMSHDIFKTQIFPLLDQKHKVMLIVIDNLRYDQWRMLAEELGDMFDIEENLYTSILPTATQYARNAIFSGLMPTQIQQMFPSLWVDEDEDEGKNLNEPELIRRQIERYRRHDTFGYDKINDSQAATKVFERRSEWSQHDLSVMVINFIDMLSHARTESKMVRELAHNENAYRNITLSWFRHSSIYELFKWLSTSDFQVVLTTDHGSIRVAKPLKIIGDRNTNTNLRYKLGKNLNFNTKQVFEIKNPDKAFLPAPNLSTSYVFATGDSFFAYPNNYNYYVSYYKDTFQHGGISMEEMLIPLIKLKPRKR